MKVRTHEVRHELRQLYEQRYRLALRLGEMTKQLQGLRQEIATCEQKIDAQTRRFAFGDEAP